MSVPSSGPATGVDALVLETDPLYESVACNCCGSAGYRVIYPAMARSHTDLTHEFRSSGDVPLTHRLVACTSCGLRFVSPRPRPEVVLAGYAAGSDEVFVSQAAARERTFDRSLSMIERWAPHRGALLDIGTAAGSFLHVAARRGWRVAGCEPSRWLCEWGRAHYGLDLRPGTLFDQGYAPGAFDVVTLWDVLEHTPDPRRVVRECHRILKPGGLVVVNYPDIGSWIARVMGRRWVMLISGHLYFFTRPTMRRLLSDEGFEIVEIRPHYQWLELGYILHRARAVAGVLAAIGQRVVTAAGLADRHVPYWIGQTLVVARKSA